MKHTEVYQKRAQHLCIFGDPKSGKSELAASCALFFKRVIWISMDNGHGVVFKLPEELLQKFEFVILPDTKEFPVAINTCLKLVEGRDTHICNAHGQVNCMPCRKDKDASYTDINLSNEPLTTCVVFDHGSQLSDSAMNFVMKGRPLEEKPEWTHYAYQGALLNKVLMNIQQAPYNTIVITHTCETEMEDGTKRLVPLCGTLNFSRNMGKFFDHIIYCRVGNKKHAFGSATTYIASVLTGSREDIVLESQNNKDGSVRPTLLPFFDGKMDEEGSKVSDVKVYNELLKAMEAPSESAVDIEAETVEETPSDMILSVANEDTEEGEVVVKEEGEWETIVDKPIITTMPDPFLISSSVSPVSTAPMSPAQAAKERLARLRATRK